MSEAQQKPAAAAAGAQLGVLRLSSEDVSKLVDMFIKMRVEKLGEPRGIMTSLMSSSEFSRLIRAAVNSLMTSESDVSTKVMPVANIDETMRARMLAFVNHLRTLIIAEAEREEELLESATAGRAADPGRSLEQFREAMNSLNLLYIITMAMLTVAGDTVVTMAMTNLPPELRSSLVNEQEGYTLIGLGRRK